MNKDQLLGNLKIALGCMHENLAHFVGNATGCHHGLQIQLAGKVQRTQGEAREIIKRSMKQQKQQLSA